MAARKRKKVVKKRKKRHLTGPHPPRAPKSKKK